MLSERGVGHLIYGNDAGADSNQADTNGASLYLWTGEAKYGNGTPIIEGERVFLDETLVGM